jgi:arsenate reductase
MKIHPIKLIRVKDKLFRELGYSKNDNRSETEWLSILSKNPRLLERPIVRTGNKTILARPPEKVLDILP